LSHGSKEFRDITFEREKELIDHHKPASLNEEADKKIGQIIDEARKKLDFSWMIR